MFLMHLNEDKIQYIFIFVDMLLFFSCIQETKTNNIKEG